MLVYSWSLGNSVSFSDTLSPSTPLYLHVAAVHDVDVRSTHVDCFGVFQHLLLAALAEGGESFLEWGHLREDGSAVSSEERGIYGREEEFYPAKRRECRLRHSIKLITVQILGQDNQQAHHACP